MALLAQEPQAPGQKERRRRKGAVMGVGLIVLALVAALGAATLLTRYMDARVSAARVPTEKVVVARLDIPVASPLKEEWLELVDWPAAARPAAAASDAAALVGRVAVVPISRGEPVLPSKLVASGARSGLATIVPSGARAVAVRVDDVVGVAGFLHPGDFVDVIATMKPKETEPYASKVVLQNVRVLAVGKDVEHRAGDGEKPASATVATLMVTPEESERLALAATKGQILLALRGIGDRELVETEGAAPAALLARAGPPGGDPRTPRGRLASAAPAGHQKQVVEILRGDLFEKRDFARPEKSP
jgi:pilus assembly protein CpaB